MQRAPVFHFESARGVKAFSAWLDEHLEEIAAAAEETTSSGTLLDIQKFAAARMLYTRFNYSTGDAAGRT
jgi:hydroxymethylglutaryl-CoA reductase (NADPH)